MIFDLAGFDRVISTGLPQCRSRLSNGPDDPIGALAARRESGRSGVACGTPVCARDSAGNDVGDVARCCPSSFIPRATESAHHPCGYCGENAAERHESRRPLLRA